MAQLKKKNKLIKKCSLCGNEENKEWIEVSPGRHKLHYFCCEQSQSTSIGFSFHRYSREPVAFGFNRKTGLPVAVDKHGKQFSPWETRYSQFTNDPYGWKATGKIKQRGKIII